MKSNKDMKRKCIFHYPGVIVDNPSVGSELRPKRMLNAFRHNGYEVFEITGNSTERAGKIKRLKNEIRNGAKYDFLYSESVNTPTILSDADHLPRHPFADFSLFKFCKRNRIPTSLFYRDAHWKFPIYKESVSKIKRSVLVPLFKYDVKMYKKYIDKIYLPDMVIKQYVMQEFDVLPLPPGGEERGCFLAEKETSLCKNEKRLEIFYVGGVYGIYDIKGFCKAVKDVDGVFLTISTPQNQWDVIKDEYADCLCDRIKIVHKTSKQLEEHYRLADIAAFCLAPNTYTDIAMPIKIFEAISYGTPVITSNSMIVSKLIQSESLGWTIDYSEENLKNTLTYLRDHPDEIIEKTKNTICAAKNHTWEARAKQVITDLT